MPLKLSNIDVSMLRTFLQTAKSSNMSLAAKELNITQPAVSTAIQKLETSLGVLLFDRTARPVQLTSAGRILRARAESIINDLDHLARDVIDASSEKSLDLRLGFSDSFGGCLSPHLLHRIISQVSNLSVYTNSTPMITEKLRRGDVDIAVATLNLNEEKDVHSQLLLTERFLVVTPCQYEGKIRSVADLAEVARNLPVIRFNDDSLDSIQVERVLRQCNVASRQRIEADTNSSVFSLVQHGIGWTVMPPLALWTVRSGLQNVAYHDILNATRSFFLHYKSPVYEKSARTLANESVKVLNELVLPEMRRENPLLARSLRIEIIEQQRATAEPVPARAEQKQGG